MLFTFPANALSRNWLNQTIIDTLINGMNIVDAGELPEEWQDCLPDDKRDVLGHKPGLRNHLNAFWQAFQNLAIEEKEAVRSAIICQTNLPELFANMIPCPSAEDLPEEVKKNADQLARYLFRQLIEIKDGGKNLRDIHFDLIHESGIRICPFCGLHYFRPPGKRRNELDHIMPISKYPFVGADFRNLAPTCNECNSYKGQTDILVDEIGARRKCSDPYSHSGPIFTVCLAGSEFGSGNEINGTRMPRWEISLLPDIPEATTWDAVYNIKSRYASTLDADLPAWVSHFASWFVREKGRNTSPGPSDVSAELYRYVCNVVQYGFDDRSFLKVEVFKFLDKSCRDRDIGQEVQDWLWEFVEYAT